MLEEDQEKNGEEQCPEEEGEDEGGCGSMALFFREHPDHSNPDRRFLDSTILRENCGQYGFDAYIGV